MVHRFPRPVRIMLVLATAIGLAVLAVAPASADFYAGVVAAQAEDYESAFREWLPLAEEGLAGAQSNLGDLYANGLGVEEDAVEAARWHLLAADQGILKSIFYMGSALAAGQGVERDYPEAIKWLLLAKGAQHPNADQILSLLSRQVSDEDAAEGQRRADNWTPTPVN